MVAVFFVCCAVVVLAWIVLIKMENRSREFLFQTVAAYVGHPSGTLTNSEDYYFLGLWTPDEHTTEDLKAKYQGNVPAQYQWCSGSR